MWPRLRKVGLAMVTILAGYLIVRGVLEFFIVDPGRPAEYANAWGGPSYWGVVAVHSGPGLVALLGVLAVATFRLRSRRAGR